MTTGIKRDASLDSDYVDCCNGCCVWHNHGDQHPYAVCITCN